MDRRERLIRQEKNKTKNARKREMGKSYRFLIAALVISVLNWFFWHDQFIGLDSKYTILFVVLPLIIGIYLYYAMNRLFLQDVFKTKPTSWWDTLGSNIFMLVIALFFGYYSMVTLANMVFKIAMDFSIKDSPIITKTYTVTKTYRNDKGRGIHLFSSVYYIDENKENHIFDVGLNEVENSDENRQIIFKCREGFFGYYKIVGYQIK